MTGKEIGNATPQISIIYMHPVQKDRHAVLYSLLKQCTFCYITGYTTPPHMHAVIIIINIQKEKKLTN